jgi:autotransporter-associated beta strand protein
MSPGHSRPPFPRSGLRSWAGIALSIVLHFATTSPADAQAFSFTAGNLTYTEDFDSMGATGTAFVPGWTSTDSTLTAGSGSSNAGGVYNVGSAGAPDRAFGSLGSGTQMPVFGASFINATGATIDSLLFTGLAEQWRTGSNAVIETTPFEFSLIATSIDDNSGAWTPLPAFDLVEKLASENGNTAVDGNDPNNRTSISATTTVTWTAGKTLWIRWREIDHPGSDGLYAIDDFRVAVTTAAPPLYWDSNGAANGVGGNGTWDNGTLNWTTDPAGASNSGSFDPNRAATFAGVAGNVQLAADGVMASAGVTFETAGYAISGGTITLGAGPVLTAHTSGVSTINSVIAGENGLKKTGNGTLRLGGVNTFAGTVMLNEGILEISADENLGAAQNDIQLNGGALALPANLILNAGRNLTGTGAIVLNNRASLTVNGNVVFTSLTVASPGTLVLAGSANAIDSATFSEPVTISGLAPVTVTTRVATTQAAGTTEWAAPLALPTGTPEFNVNDGTSPIDLLIDGIISGIGRLLKIGDGTVRITGNNANWNGSVRLGVAGATPLNGGRIVIAHQNALGSGTGVQMQFNDGILEAETALTGANAIPIGVSIGPGFVSGVVFTGADMEFTGVVQLFRPAATALQHNIVVNNHVTFSGPFSISTSTGASTGITLSGGGTLTLANPGNDVAEPISIEGATMILAGGANAELGSGFVHVKSGVLRGEGRVHDLSVGDGFGDVDDAELLLGTPLGTLIAGSVTFESDATLRLEINSSSRTADQLRANGPVTLGDGVARLIVTDIASALLAPGTEFTLIENESLDPLATTGFFAGLADHAQLQIGLNRFEIDYESGANANDVLLRALPEPSSAAFAASSAFLVILTSPRLTRRSRQA